MTQRLPHDRDIVARVKRGMAPRIVADTTWKNLVLLNGLTNFGPPYPDFQYMLDPHGFVHLRGVVHLNGAGLPVVAGVLAIGYRPEWNERFVCAMGAITVNVEVSTNGTVTIGPA